MKRVGIQYQTVKTHCHCCEQKLLKPIKSDLKTFWFREKDILEWDRVWKDVVEYEEDFIDCVKEFVYETVSFYSVDSLDTLIIKESEIKKVKQFILEEIID